MLLMALQLAAATAVLLPQAPPIGKPGCNTICGGVMVPYPFGFGSSRCYWPGLNLTCDTSHGGTPRLLLGDGTLRVTEISLHNATVRVVRTGSVVNATGDFTSFGRGFVEHGYFLSYRNELVVTGCNVMGTLLADTGENAPRVIGGCSSFCTVQDDASDMFSAVDDYGEAMELGKYCTGTTRCCQARLSGSTRPREVQVKWLHGGTTSHAVEQRLVPVNVFVAEEGWVDLNGLPDQDLVLQDEEVPLVLRWGVTRGLW
ncbi:hypothetical protein HU200_029225 [Digitaria exilis]|uniref:Wall-associated receptor kinase galacturonan-binding domain-containing protein n=1 Tax=Digitaria exilis TaxID=1010633 RepID=A0A835ES05_9POAL|nr:hypothetical protein HU200_029225 [Digitaria exilis]